MERLSDEVKLLHDLNHTNIINLYASWQTESEVVFITEYMTGGTLRECVKRREEAGHSD